MYLSDRDVSILVQVALKEAAPKFDLSTQEGQADFEVAFSYITESLIGAVKAAAEAHTSPTPTVNTPPAAGGQQDGADMFAQAGMTSVVVKGQQQGPLPDWLIAACAAKNISEVFDNRGGQNPKAPWFKSADKLPNHPDAGNDGRVPFWPPKGS